MCIRDSPYIYFREGATTGKAYIQWTASTGSLDFRNYETGGFIVKSMTDSTWWQMQTNTSVVRGSFYADCTDSIGILDKGGTWTYRTVNDSCHSWLLNNTEYMKLTSTLMQVTGQICSIYSGYGVRTSG